MDTRTSPLSFEQALAQQARLRAQYPALADDAHVREVLAREGWLATRWLRTLLTLHTAPAGPVTTTEGFPRLAQAVSKGAVFELAVDHVTELDHGPDADRVRVAQELVWAAKSLARDGIVGAPRVLWFDLLERAEDAFGDSQSGPREVATPAIEPPMSAQDQNALLKALTGVLALAAAVLTGVATWKTASPGPALLWGLAAGLGTALVVRPALPWAREAVPGTEGPGH